MKYIDIHGHINFPEFDADRAEVIKRAQDLDVGMISVGVDIQTSRSAIDLASPRENMWATVGLHPTDIYPTNREKVDLDLAELETLATNPKVVAIGECGLDYFHSKPEAAALQKEIFIEQIKIANKVNKPLMLHVRNGRDDRNAYQDALVILQKHAKTPFNFHFFAGGMQDLKDILEAGGTVSFTGVLSFTGDYDELVKYVPADQIMSETDCPFVAPTPYRGKRNEPSFVVEVVKAIARIRGEDEPVVSKQLVMNAKSFFGI